MVVQFDALPFDPLVAFYGLWNTRLADRYLPIPELPNAEFECWDGFLFFRPYQRAEHSFGKARLGSLLREGAKAAGLYVYGAVNLQLGVPERWVQSDLTLLRSLERGRWVSGEHCVMVVEFVSPSSRRRDRIDKPAACASAGIPWYMTVELAPEHNAVLIELNKLKGNHYALEARVRQGEQFEITEPFTASFDALDLLGE